VKRKTKVLLIVALATLMAVPVVAIAADRFNDVPTTNVFHDDIGWLASVGVTLGCNPPANDDFCPDDPVKRQQMAAFIRRFAAYLGAEDGVVDAADDADTVDGYHATELSPVVAGANWDIDATAAPLNEETIAEVTITAPADGVLVMNATGDSWNGTGDVWCTFQLDAGALFPPGMERGYVDHVQDSEADCVTSGIAEVTAGDHTVGLVYDGDSRYIGQMSVVWYPHGTATLTAATSSASRGK
jgi:hypothetical protein